MVHPVYIYVLLLLAGFAVQLTCAGNLVVQSVPLPVIQGRINGMGVVVQGESAIFLAGQFPGDYNDESCTEDLHCTLHRNHTRAVQLSPDGITLLQLNPDYQQQNENEGDESGDPVLPSMTLNTLKSSGTTRFEKRFIPTGEIEPTPTLVTLYTGNPVVDQTPGLAWINSETIKLLATTVETMNLLSRSTSSVDDDFTLVNPSPTGSVKVLTTIPGELDELRRRLMSSATVPVPTPVQTKMDDPEPESDEFILVTDTGILMIRPSSTQPAKYSSPGSYTMSWQPKQAPVTGAGSSSVSVTETAHKQQVETVTAGVLQSPSPEKSGRKNSLSKAASGLTLLGAAKNKAVMQKGTQRFTGSLPDFRNTAVTARDRYDALYKIFRIHHCRIICDGKYGAVHKFKGERDQVFAVKILKTSAPDSGQWSGMAKGEVCALQLQHPNLVRTYGVLLFNAQERKYYGINRAEQIAEQIAGQDRGCYCVKAIVMEYLDGFTLQGLLERSHIVTDQKTAIHYGVPVARALAYIHEAGFVYRDLKLENIMVIGDKDHQQVKLVDFGFSKPLADHGTTSTICGTWYYFSPEMMSRRKWSTGSYTKATDNWSLGVLLMELANDITPGDINSKGEEVSRRGDAAIFNAIEYFAGLSQVEKQRHLEYYARIPRSSPLNAIISRLLDTNPETRMTAAQAEKELTALRAAIEQLAP